MKNFIKNTAVRTAVYFTVIVSVFSLFVLLINSDTSSVSMDPGRILMFLPFCLCFAIANTLIRYKNIGAVTRWISHAALTVIGAYIFIILPAELEQSSAEFMGLIIISVIYAVGILICSVFSARIKAAIKEDKQLKKQIKH